MIRLFRSCCLLYLVALVAMTAGCAESSPAVGNKPPEQPAALKLLVVDQPELVTAVGRVRDEWQAQAGSTLEVVEMTGKEVATAEKLAADVVIYTTPLLGTLAEKKFIRPLLPRWLQSEKLQPADLLQAVDAPEYCWDGQPYALSLGQPTLVLVYRADIFEGMGEQPPTTWIEYQNLAKRLQATLEQGAMPMLNTVEPTAPRAAVSMLLARAAAYARHRDYFSVLFDRDTMEPLIAGPAFTRALDEMVAANVSKEKPRKELTSADTVDLVIRGKAVMGIGWPICLQSEPNQTKVDDARIKVAPLPGSREAFNPRNQQWEVRRNDEATSVPVRGSSGLVASITRGTANADAAFGLLAWLTTDPWDRDLVLNINGGIPFRKSHAEFLTQRLGPMLGEPAARQLLEVLAISHNESSAVLVPRLPGEIEYMDALDEAVQAAISGEQTPQEALDTAADKWREITAKLGKNQQLAAYRRSLRAAE